MFKMRLTTIIFLLGIVFCMGLSQTAESEETETAESEETKDDKDKTKADKRIPVPHGGFTIVLRAPTSEKPRIVKISRDGEGNKKSETIEGFSVYLPEKTPIFFRVDQVNTVLYNVSISVKQEQSQGENLPLQLFDILDILEKIVEKLQSLVAAVNQGTVKLIGDDTPQALKKLVEKLETLQLNSETLQCNLKAAKALNSKLDELLYASEKPEFSGFENIKENAEKAAKEAFGKDNTFKLDDGTHREFLAGVEETIADFHEACSAVKEHLSDPGLSCLLGKENVLELKKLCDSGSDKAKEITAVFAYTAKKLGMIEAAKWHKDDAQVRVLSEKITYTCVICPAMELPAEKYSKLDHIEFVVTVNGIPELSGSQVTFGSFMTGLHDDTYLKINNKISKGLQDRFTENFGILTHIPLYSRNFDCLKFLKFRAAAAISGGIGLNKFSDNDGKFSLAELPTMLGVSLLFARQKSGSLLALTAGGMIKPVQRLNGYSLGNTFPQGVETVTRPVRTFGWFFAITISYDIREVLKRTGNQTASQ